MNYAWLLPIGAALLVIALFLVMLLIAVWPEDDEIEKDP